MLRTPTWEVSFLCLTIFATILLENETNEEERQIMNHHVWKNSHLDKETLLILAIISVMAAIGMLAFIGGLVNIEIMDVGIRNLIGMTSGLSGGIFGVLVWKSMTRKKR